MSLQNDLSRKNDEIAVKQTAMAGLFQGVTDLTGTAAQERRDAIKHANAELSALASERDELKSLADMEAANTAAIKAQQKPVGRQAVDDGQSEPNGPEAIKSIADLLRGHDGYQASLKSGKPFRGNLGEIDFDAVKATITTTMISPQRERLPFLPDAQETRTTSDLMLQGTTNAGTLEYYEETTFTNAAAETAEAGAKPESALDFTLVSEPIRKIATWVPVTDETLADNEGFESYLRGRLGFMLRQREETQVLTGNGTAPNIRGILNRTGIQTQARGTDPTPDAIFKAMTKVRNTGFAEPTAVVLHPNDWQDIRLLRTADGLYIWGSPSEAGPERIWGLEVRVTGNITENTGLVGAFRPDAQLFRKGGVELAVSDSHASNFTSDILVVRVEERIGLAVYRPASFCSVTGI